MLKLDLTQPPCRLRRGQMQVHASILHVPVQLNLCTENGAGCILVMHSHCQRSLLTPGHDTIASAIAWPWASSRPLLYKARALSRHKAARSHHTVWFHVLSSRKPRMLLGIMKTSNAVKVCCLPQPAATKAVAEGGTACT